MKNFLLIGLVLCFFTVNKAFSYSFSALNNEGKTIYYYITSSNTVDVTTNDDGYEAYAGDLIIPSTVTNSGTTYTVTGIGGFTFYECYALTSVTIPATVTLINDIFESCSGLIDVHVDPNNANYCSVNGILFTKSQDELMKYPAGKTASSYVIPGTVNTIADYAFAACENLTSITMPASVVSIGNLAFFYCIGLKSIVLGSSVATIGDGAFHYCLNLETITLGAALTSMAENAFQSCDSLKTFIVDPANPLYSSDNGVLFDKTKEKLILFPVNHSTVYSVPNSVKIIGKRAFIRNKRLTGVTFPNSLTTIEEDAFSSCSALNSLTFGASLIEIGENAFYSCTSLTVLTIPDAVKFIGERAFYACTGLNSITLGNALDSIRAEAFARCGTFTALTIPHSVTYIGQEAFADCEALASLTLGNSLKVIEEGAFSGCENLLSVVIPDSVTTIGNEAFADCSAIKTLSIGNSVTRIGNNAFEYCTNLTDLKLGNSVRTIGREAFYSCDSLKSVLIPHATTSIGASAFAFCVSLDTVIMGNSVRTISESAFEDCGSLTFLRLNDSIRTIGAYAFNYCSSLTSVVLPPFLESINDATFMDCSALKTLTLGSMIDFIDTRAFEDCTALDTIYIRATTPPEVYSSSFRNVPKGIPVFVPCGTATDYQSWGDFTNIIGDLLPQVFVRSNDTNMGTAILKQANTSCDNNTAIIEATANMGYQFVSWSDGETNNLRTITVTRDTFLTAIFADPTGIVDGQNLAFLHFYPNPVRDKITISLPENATNAVFTLYDMQGRVLIKQNVDNNDVVLVNGFPSGIYVYSMVMDGKRQQGKLSIVE